MIASGGNRTWAGARAQRTLKSLIRACHQRTAFPFAFLAQALCQPNPPFISARLRAAKTDAAGLHRKKSAPLAGVAVRRKKLGHTRKGPWPPGMQCRQSGVGYGRNATGHDDRRAISAAALRPYTPQRGVPPSVSRTGGAEPDAWRKKSRRRQLGVNKWFIFRQSQAEKPHFSLHPLQTNTPPNVPPA